MMDTAGALEDERHPESHSPDLRPRRIKPGAIAPGSNEAAATHNRPQRIFRRNLRPARARRLSEAGRHWAPIARQRATREARHSGLAWPTYCNKPKRAPPVMDGMGRTVAQGDRRCPPENAILASAVFRVPGQWRRRRPCWKFADRPGATLQMIWLNVRNKTDRSRCWRRSEIELSTHSGR